MCMYMLTSAPSSPRSLAPHTHAHARAHVHLRLRIPNARGRPLLHPRPRPGAAALPRAPRSAAEELHRRGLPRLRLLLRPWHAAQRLRRDARRAAHRRGRRHWWHAAVGRHRRRRAQTLRGRQTARRWDRRLWVPHCSARAPGRLANQAEARCRRRGRRHPPRCHCGCRETPPPCACRRRESCLACLEFCFKSVGRTHYKLGL